MVYQTGTTVSSDTTRRVVQMFEVVGGSGYGHWHEPGELPEHHRARLRTTRPRRVSAGRQGEIPTCRPRTAPERGAPTTAAGAGVANASRTGARSRRPPAIGRSSR